MSKELASLLFPDVTQSVEDIIKTRLTDTPAFRFAPSPTGYLHIGSMASALCDFMLGKTMNGKCYIRIEDTDQKREVEGAAQLLIDTLQNFGITFDNKPIFQSERIDKYHVFAKRLVEQGRAYPCFCTEQQLQNIRTAQETQKLRTGYHGEFAQCKNLTLQQIEKNIDAKMPWVLRMNFDAATADNRITWHDLVRGEMSLPYEVNNAVVLKSNGVPPYNLAAAVDDILMGITHIIRGEEWLSSTAEHIQLYNALGFEHPNYCHLPVICIEEDGKKRKLSKRKDREAIAQNFLDAGYPKDALIEYLLTIYNTDYELWREANPNTPWQQFNFRFEKIGSNSPLFDWDKLNDISKNMIAKMSCDEINEHVKKYFGDKFTDTEYQKIFTVLAVDRGTDRPRKDIVRFGEIPEVFDYLFKHVKLTPLLEKYAVLVNSAATKDEWFAECKARATEFGFKNVREFTQRLRVDLTGREHTTDLYVISKLLLGSL